MSRSGIGQSDTKWLKRAQEMTDACGTPASTWREGEWCCWYRHDAFLPQRYATSHLTRLWQSPRDRWIISMRRRWETVSNAFEISTTMAMVLLGGLRWLKPETTLAEMGSRAEAVECLFLKPCWKEQVPSASTMAGRMSRSRIFTAGQSSEKGWQERPCSRGFPAFSIRIMRELFKIAGMLIPATERLKSSVRKAKPCGARWRRWSLVSPSGPWAEEEPAFLMAARACNAPHVKRPVWGIHSWCSSWCCGGCS